MAAAPVAAIFGKSALRSSAALRVRNPWTAIREQRLHVSDFMY